MRGNHNSIITDLYRATDYIQRCRVHELLECFSLRGESHRDGGKGLTTYYRGGNIISYHVAIGRVRKPLERHRPCQLHVRAPTGTAIDRGDETSIELTGSIRTIGIRKVVVGECEVRPVACSVFIDSDASSKVINAAADRIDGNALHCCPGDSIGRGAHYDISSATVCFKAAIGPDDVDCPCLVDFSGGKRATAICCLLDVIGDGRYDNGIIPACPTVRRGVCIDMVYVGGQVGSIDGHDDGASGLNERLSSQGREGLMLWAFRSSPREADVVIIQFNLCTSTLLLGASGSTSNPNFQIDKKLLSVSLSATISVPPLTLLTFALILNI
jgi:hypothetical protein